MSSDPSPEPEVRRSLVALRALLRRAEARGAEEECRRLRQRLDRLTAGARGAPPSGSPEPESAAASSPDPGSVGRGASSPAVGAGEEGEALAAEVSALADEGWSDPAEGATEDAQVYTETMARLCLEQGCYDEAEEIYRALVRRRPDDPELRERLQEARRRKSDAGERSRVPAAGAPKAAAEEGGDMTADARAHFRALLAGRAGGGVPDAAGEAGPEEERPGGRPAGERAAAPAGGREAC